jgi:hypothetical protein
MVDRGALFVPIDGFDQADLQSTAAGCGNFEQPPNSASWASQSMAVRSAANAKVGPCALKHRDSRPFAHYDVRLDRKLPRIVKTTHAMRQSSCRLLPIVPFANPH